MPPWLEDDVAHDRQVLVEDLDDLLRRVLLGVRREAADVAEHDRHDLALAAEAQAVVGAREHVVDDRLGHEAREQVAHALALERADGRRDAERADEAERRARAADRAPRRSSPPLNASCASAGEQHAPTRRRRAPRAAGRGAASRPRRAARARRSAGASSQPGALRSGRPSSTVWIAAAWISGPAMRSSDEVATGRRPSATAPWRRRRRPCRAASRGSTRPALDVDERHASGRVPRRAGEVDPGACRRTSKSVARHDRPAARELRRDDRQRQQPATRRRPGGAGRRRGRWGGSRCAARAPISRDDVVAAEDVRRRRPRPTSLVPSTIRGARVDRVDERVVGVGVGARLGELDVVDDDLAPALRQPADDARVVRAAERELPDRA